MSSAADIAPSASPARTRLSRVDELDVVRVLTFACVIAVHVIGEATSNSRTAGGFLVLLHFTREAFFWLTGFVLVLNYGRRHLQLARFWRRRFQLVGIPYLLWSLGYCLLDRVASSGRTPSWPGGVVQDVLYGTAWYHLYFLLVTLQVYLLFPLLAALLRATARHHVALLVVSGALEVAVLTGLHWTTPWSSWQAGFNEHQNVLIWNYQFWVISGGVAAWHVDGLRDWLSRHRRATAVGCALAACVTLGYYVSQLDIGVTPTTASAVLQPITILCTAAAVLTMFLLGQRYAQLPANQSLRRMVDTASDRSFAVFLVHPAFIWFFPRIDHGWGAAHVNNVLYVIGLYVAVLAASVVTAEVLRRIPLSLVLTGRPMLRRSRVRVRTSSAGPRSA
ncbi:acyltransferase [uncultured Jatrophihabitans sp.]|uniref:acyltransferase n=1 Tax=uncultured Jatrophihabitans sp. TaxID=1610747 RepID=UPI0035CBB5DE